MREFETEKTIQDAISMTPVGKEVKIQFSGNPNIIDIEMTFTGGWVVYQTIFPGKALKFTKGEDQYLESINITINSFDGLK